MKPKRIQINRREPWNLGPDTVPVVGPLRCPYRVGKRHPVTAAPISPIEFVELFRASLTPEKRQLIREQLYGKNLACWCGLDQPCHADVLLEIANGAEESDRSKAVKSQNGDITPVCGSSERSILQRSVPN